MWGKNERESNIELFRIITMLLIVAHHFVVNSGLMSATGPIYNSGLNWRTVFLLIMGAWGKIGINCFVLITGYFMCRANVTVQKFCKLLCQVMFYKILLTLIFLCSGYEGLVRIDVVKALLPIYAISTDFVQCFLLYFLAIPFINRLISALKQKEHMWLIILCLFIYTFFGTFHQVRMNYISWFIILHFVAAYIRVYPKLIYADVKLWVKLLCGCITLDIASILFCYLLGQKFGRNIAYFFVTDSNTFLALLTGLAAFMVFKQLPVKKNTWINLVASATFGVLLIHANSDTMRRWLWKDVVDVVGHFDSAYLVPYATGSVVVIFCVCAVLDLIRQRFVEPVLLKACDVLIENARNAKLLERF